MRDIDIPELVERVSGRLDALCLHHPDRSVGSAGGVAATEYVAAQLATLGLEAERIGFSCVVWDPGAADLTIAGRHVALNAGPYSPTIDVEARLVCASTLNELRDAESSGAVLLLHGAIATEQLVPKNYPFYQMERHTAIISELERQAPAVVIAATGRNPGAVGSLYPFPLFEDGDFPLPSAYLTDVEGELVASRAGDTASVRIASSVEPGRGEQLVARIPGTGPGRFVVSAHIDSRHSTPGAIDNAAGVCVLLGVAEYLADAGLTHTVELVPFNGEDNFAAYGEMAYLRGPGADLSDVTLAINIDAAGYREGTSAVSTYGCGEQMLATLEQVLRAHARVTAGPAWPQSDHMIFAMRGVPAIAITTSEFETVTSRYTHGPDDLPPLIDPGLVVATSRFIADLLVAIDSVSGDSIEQR